MVVILFQFLQGNQEAKTSDHLVKYFLLGGIPSSHTYFKSFHSPSGIGFLIHLYVANCEDVLGLPFTRFLSLMHFSQCLLSSSDT